MTEKMLVSVIFEYRVNQAIRDFGAVG